MPSPLPQAARPVFWAALLISTSGAWAGTHEKVQQALDWQLPENPCEKPESIDGAGVSIGGGFVRHAPTNTTGTNDRVPMVFGVDRMKMERYERQRARWESCVSDYKAKLLQDFERLKASAQYGLTRQQAETIVGKLAQIQAAVMSPDGIAEDADDADPER